MGKFMLSLISYSIVLSALPVQCYLSGDASLTDILVISGGAFFDALVSFKQPFENASMYKINASQGSASSIPVRLAEGELADLVISSKKAVTELATKGLVKTSGLVDLAVSQIGMAVKQGSPIPDISTVEQFKAALLQADSIAFFDKASGIYLESELFPRLGIANLMAEKKTVRVPADVGNVVAHRGAEIGFAQMSELLPTHGITIVGPIPNEVQSNLTVSAGIPTRATNSIGAMELIHSLTSPWGMGVIEKAGLVPAVPVPAPVSRRPGNLRGSRATLASDVRPQPSVSNFLIPTSPPLHVSTGERSWRLLPLMKPPFETEAQQHLYDDLISGVKPELGRGVLALARAISDDTTVEVRVREMPILVVAAYMQSEPQWYVHSRIASKHNVSEGALSLMKELAPAGRLDGKLKHDELAVYKMFRELMVTNRVRDDTYKAALEALDNDRRKIAYLVMTMGCYSTVSQILNLFGVPLHAGATLAFPVDGKVEPLHEPQVMDAVLSTGNRSWRLLPLMKPPFETEAQQQFYDDLVSGAIGGPGAAANPGIRVDEEGALKGPWQVQALKPELGRGVLQVARAISDDTTVEVRLREMPVLVIAAYIQSELEWYVHSRIALQHNVSEEALPLMKELAPADRLDGKLKHDELAVYKMFRELMVTNRVRDDTYKAALEALDNDRRKIAYLAMTMGCYSTVSQILNLFGVPLDAGATLAFPVDGRAELRN